MFETLVSFEPTFTLNGIPISPSGCQAPLLRKTSGEGKSVVAVTHLALLGVKRQEPAFWAYTEDERELLATLFFARISKGNANEERRRRFGFAYSYRQTLDPRRQKFKLQQEILCETI